MTPRVVIAWLLRLALLLSVVAGSRPTRLAHAPPGRVPGLFEPAGEAPRGPGVWAERGPGGPGSEGTLAVAAPVGWAVIERRVLRGIERGVARFRLGTEDRDDAVAIALERAWHAHDAAEQPILHPEAWARTIAARVCLDVVRRHQRERRWLAPADEAQALAERVAAPVQDPFEATAAAERRAILRQRLASWTQQERELASVLLDGQAESVSAAARLVRAREVARGRSGAMYPHKARVLLDARRRELADLV